MIYDTKFIHHPKNKAGLNLYIVYFDINIDVQYHINIIECWGWHEILNFDFKV
jgi:hypothetical protein